MQHYAHTDLIFAKLDLSRGKIVSSVKGIHPSPHGHGECTFDWDKIAKNKNGRDGIYVIPDTDKFRAWDVTTLAIWNKESLYDVRIFRHAVKPFEYWVDTNARVNEANAGLGLVGLLSAMHLRVCSLERGLTDRVGFTSAAPAPSRPAR